MTLSFICSACRRSLAQRARLETTQLRLTSTFVSLDSSARQIGTNGDVKQASKAPKRNTWKTKRHNAEGQRAGDFLETLFKESIQLNHNPDDGGSLQASLALQTYEDTEVLQNLVSAMKRNGTRDDILRAWEHLRNKFGPSEQSAVPGRLLPPSSLHFASQILEHLLGETKKNDSGKEFPTIADICFVFSYIGLLKQSDWNNMIVVLLNQLASNSAATLDRTSDRTNITDPTLSDLMNTWKQLEAWMNRDWGRSSADAGTKWKLLSPPNHERQAKLRQTLLTRERFQDLPHFDTIRRPRPIYLLDRFHALGKEENGTKSFLALVTYAILLECSSVGSRLGEEKNNSAFVGLFTDLLLFYETDVTSTDFISEINRMASVLDLNIAKLEIQWPKVFERLNSCSTTEVPKNFGRNILGSMSQNRRENQRLEDLARQEDERTRKEQSSGPGKGHSSVRRPVGIDFPTIHQSLAKARERRDVDEVDKLWQTARVTATAALCNHFILSYASLKDLDSAIDVWNHMIQSSIQPDLSTWNAMLEGCRIARSFASLDGVWKRLLASGMRPDGVCWTTRIAGLSDSHKPVKAVQALEEMRRVWITAAKKRKINDLKNAGDIDDIVKPSTAAVNAALAGLAQFGDNAAVTKVLAWAAQIGIQPDIITFNILLRPLVRNGSTTAIKNILTEMENVGIEADITTFTVMIREILRESLQKDPSERVKIINGALDQMAAAGVLSNLHTYGEIINTELNSPEGDLAVVQAILTRMSNEDLEIGPHIATTLVQYYFSVSDLEAVRAVVERVRLARKWDNKTDHIFWDIVISGYAQAGQTGPALTLYGQIDREGHRVGWYAMRDLLVALVKVGEEERARELTTNVRAERGASPPLSAKGVDGQLRFWQVVAEYDLGKVRPV